MAHSLVTEATKGLPQSQGQGQGSHQNKDSPDVDVTSIRSMAGKMTTFMVRASFEKIHAKLLDSHQGLVQRLVAQTSANNGALSPSGYGSGPGQGIVEGQGRVLVGNDNEGIYQDLDPPDASLPPVQGLIPRPSSHRGKG